MSDRILRINEVLRLVPVSRATLYRLIRRGEFPKPVQLGSNAVGWRESMIQEWIKARPEAR